MRLDLMENIPLGLAWTFHPSLQIPAKFLRSTETTVYANYCYSLA
jgi:hypothetical protein